MPWCPGAWQISAWDPLPSCCCCCSPAGTEAVQPGLSGQLGHRSSETLLSTGDLDYGQFWWHQGAPFKLSLTPDTFFIPYPTTFKSEEEIGECSLDTVTKLWDLGLQCKGAAAPISLRHEVLYQLSLLQQEAPRVSTAKLCWPAYGAREGWRELFYPFSVPCCQVIVHGQVGFHNSLRMIWYLIWVAGFALKRIDMLQNCQLWSHLSTPFRTAE